MVDQTSNPLSIQQLGQYLNGQVQPNAIPMIQDTAQTALSNGLYASPQYQMINGQNSGTNNPLQNFMNTPQYQLAYGNNQAADPSERFRNDTGTQLAIQQGMNTLQNQYAAKGLGGSGALAKSLGDYQYNHYNDWMNNQVGMQNNYNTNTMNTMQSYQSQLANLAQFGSTQTGGAQGLQNSQQLASLLGNANLATGQNLSSAQLGVGENLAQLSANQGVYGGNAYLGTAAGQSNNIMQGMSLATQIANMIQAGNASAAGGQGAMLGSQAGMGNQGYPMGYSAPGLSGTYSSPVSSNNGFVSGRLF